MSATPVIQPPPGPHSSGATSQPSSPALMSSSSASTVSGPNESSSPTLVSPTDSQSSDSSWTRLQPEPVMIPPALPSRSQLNLSIPQPPSPSDNPRYSTQANDSSSDLDSALDSNTSSSDFVTKHEEMHYPNDELADDTTRGIEWEQDRLQGLPLEVRLQREHERELERLGLTSAVSMLAMGPSRSQLTLVPANRERPYQPETPRDLLTLNPPSASQTPKSLKSPRSRPFLGLGRRDRESHEASEGQVSAPSIRPTRSQLTLSPAKQEDVPRHEAVDESSGSSPSAESQEDDLRGRSPTPQSPTRANKKLFHIFSSGKPFRDQRPTSPSSPTFSSSQLSLPLQVIPQAVVVDVGHKPKSRNEGFITKKLFGYKGKEKEKARESLESWDMFDDSSVEETLRAKKTTLTSPARLQEQNTVPLTEPSPSLSSIHSPPLAAHAESVHPKRHSMLDRPIPAPPIAPPTDVARPPPPPPPPLRSSASQAPRRTSGNTHETPRSVPGLLVSEASPQVWTRAPRTTAPDTDEARQVNQIQSPVTYPQPPSHPHSVSPLRPSTSRTLSQAGHLESTHLFYPFAPSPPPSISPASSPISIKSGVTYIDYGPGTPSTLISPHSFGERPRRPVAARSPLYVAEAYDSLTEDEQESPDGVVNTEQARRERSRSTSPAMYASTHSLHGPRPGDRRHTAPHPFAPPSSSPLANRTITPVSAVAEPEPDNRVVSVIGDIIDLYDHTPAPTNPNITLASLEGLEHSDQLQQGGGDSPGRHYPGRPLPLPPGVNATVQRPVSADLFLAGLARRARSQEGDLSHQANRSPIQVAYTSSLPPSPPFQAHEGPRTQFDTSPIFSGSSNSFAETESTEGASPTTSRTQDDEHPSPEYTDLDVLLSRIDDEDSRTGDNYEVPRISLAPSTKSFSQHPSAEFAARAGDHGPRGTCPSCPHSSCPAYRADRAAAPAGHKRRAREA